MKQSNRAQLRNFILEYHKTHSLTLEKDLELDDDVFFDIERPVEVDMNTAMTQISLTGDTAFLNTLLEKVEQYGTLKEQYIFLCLLRGYGINRTAEIFNLDPRNIRYKFDKLLDKICIHSNSAK
ncbi:hypothetical protein [Macrococcus epidermidis]|uniref:hypothetical protein n=1 Tax=Macrococcus epidermidis TaxID=1902580 RepID=UPI0020B6E8C4|nr:hypothetical protein [Macrococcus epidermidis]UTH16173.1 hypothetical protein KFV12_13125 [Macrococcus epidermidis]